MQTLKVVLFYMGILMVTTVSMALANEFKKDGFAITLPDAWVEIPGDSIAAYEKEAVKRLQNAQAVNYDYGFQLKTSKEWFTHPYFLIQVKNTGRISEHQLNEFETLSVPKTVDQINKAVSSALLDFQVDKMVHDKENNILWMRMEVKAANVGDVVGLIGMVPTEKGIIQVNGYCVKADYPKYEPVFRSVVISTTPDPDLVYKVNTAGSNKTTEKKLDWGKVLKRALLWGLFGGLIGALVSFFKKKIAKNK